MNRNPSGNVSHATVVVLLPLIHACLHAVHMLILTGQIQTLIVRSVISNRSSLPMVQGLPAERTLALICTLPSGRRSSPTRHFSTRMWVVAAGYWGQRSQCCMTITKQGVLHQDDAIVQVKGHAEILNICQLWWCSGMESMITIIAGGWVCEVPDGGPADCSTVLPLQCATKHCKWNLPTSTDTYTSSLMTY